MTYQLPSYDDIVDNFAFLDNWEDRYRYIIDLGKDLPALDDVYKNDAYKVPGCASQVWLVAHSGYNHEGQPILTFEGDSDAHIVRGLVVLVLSMFSGRTIKTIQKLDTTQFFEQLGLHDAITTQRANGLRSMIAQIKAYAASTS